MTLLIVSILIIIVAVKNLSALPEMEKTGIDFTRVNMTSNVQQNISAKNTKSKYNFYNDTGLTDSITISKNNTQKIKNGRKLVSKLNTNKAKTKNLKSTKNKENITIITKGKKKRNKKRGKVFVDSQEDALQLKLIDNMLFKNVESNNSVSIVFSDESEITEDRVRQAIEDGDGSLVAIPLKRKKDAFKELLRWKHLHEKNKLRAKVEKEVFEKYKDKMPANFTIKPSTRKVQLHPPVIVHKMYSENKTLVLMNKNTSYVNRKVDLVVGHTGKQKKNLNNTQSHKSSDNKYFREESVEFQFDPDFANKLYKSVKDQQKAHDDEQKKVRWKKKKKTKKELFDFNRPEISDEDYSAHEAFIVNTRKEATGRRFYQDYLNKSASEFWDNNTRETTKMLEVLLPLGEHLHKTLDKVPPNEGMHFMTDLRIYKTQLEKFIALAKQDKAETRPDVVELLEEPYDHVCETKYCDEEVKIMFGWSDEEFKNFEKLYDEMREMWFDLQMFHHCYQFVSGSIEEEPWSLYNCSESDIYNISSRTFKL